MSNTDKPTKLYQLWIYHGSSEGWSYRETDTLENAIQVSQTETYGSQFFISRRVDYKVVEENL